MIVRNNGTETLRKNLFGGNGEAEIETLFTPEEFSADVRLCARLTLPPGGGIGLHRHTDEDELYFILQGEGSVDDGDMVSRVYAGTSILTRSGESHSLLNTGTEDLVLIAVIPRSDTH